MILVSEKTFKMIMRLKQNTLITIQSTINRLQPWYVLIKEHK